MASIQILAPPLSRYGTLGQLHTLFLPWFSLCQLIGDLNFFLKKCLFIFEREREREREIVSIGGAEREGDTESEAGSRLQVVSTEPDAGLELTDREIMTWAEFWRLTDCATQAPLSFIFNTHGWELCKLICSLKQTHYNSYICISFSYSVASFPSARKIILATLISKNSY